MLNKKYIYIKTNTFKKKERNVQNIFLKHAGNIFDKDSDVEAFQLETLAVNQIFPSGLIYIKSISVTPETDTFLPSLQ